MGEMEANWSASALQEKGQPSLHRQDSVCGIVTPQKLLHPTRACVVDERSRWAKPEWLVRVAHTDLWAGSAPAIAACTINHPLDINGNMSGIVPDRFSTSGSCYSCGICLSSGSPCNQSNIQRVVSLLSDVSG